MYKVEYEYLANIFSSVGGFELILNNQESWIQTIVVIKKHEPNSYHYVKTCIQIFAKNEDSQD